MQYPFRLGQLLASGLLALLVLAAPVMAQEQGPTNLALSKPALASAIEASLVPTQANDGNMSTRWGSGAAGEQWWAVDLGETRQINLVRLFWEAAYATAYDLRVSDQPLPSDPLEVDVNDASAFTTVHSATGGDGGLDVISLENVSARTLAVVMLEQGPFATYSLWEVEVYAEQAGAVSGVVSGPAGALQGAVVRLAGGGLSLTAQTDASGAFSFSGLLPGQYTLTALQPGVLAPVTQEVTLAAGQTLTQDLTLSQATQVTPFAFPLLGADWIATEEDPGNFSPNFDFAFPLEELPASPVTANGITFQLGPTEAGASNVVSLPNATFLVPQARYAAIHTLASSTAGPYVGTATLSYADGTQQEVPFRVSDWFAAPTGTEQEGILVTYRLNADGRADEGASIRIFHNSIPADPSKELVSFGFSEPQAGSPPNVQAYAFAVTLESLDPLPQLGTLSGTVSGPSGPLSGAVVNIGPYTVTTDASGSFSLPNLPPGDYTVTAFQPGQFAPVSQAVTLAAAGTQTVTITLSAQPNFVQYPLAYTHDWASSHEEPGDYFAADTAYPAESLPPAGPAVLGGIQFAFPSTADGARNVLIVDGQRLPVPPAHYSAIHLLESAGWGTQTGLVTLTYEDGTTETVTVSFTDWFGSPSPREQEAIVVDHRHGPGNPDQNVGARIKIFSQTLPVNSGKLLTAITLPPHVGDYNSQLGFIWAMTLEALDAPQTGTVSGTITGASGPVAGALVSLGGFGQVATDAQGQFTIANAPVGTHELTVIAPAGSNLAGGSASVTVAAGQTVTADVPQLGESPTQVFSRLLDARFESGLRQVESPSVPNSVTTVVTAAGEEARQVPAGGRFYFSIDPSFAAQLGEGPAYVQVSYLDQGTGSFRLHYNSSDATISDMGRYAKQAGEPVTLGGSGQWTTHLFTIDDPGFLNMLTMGASLYLEAVGAPLTVRDVIVSRTESITPIPPPSALKLGDANGDGVVDVRDAVHLLRSLVGLAELTPEQRIAADADRNGETDVRDVVRLLRAVVGLEEL